MDQARRSLAPPTFALLGAALLHCSSGSSSPGARGDSGSSSAAKGDGGDDSGSSSAASDDGDDGDNDDACFPDNDGTTGINMPATFVLTVDDTGFSKMLLTTQNDTVATLTLTNNGAKPHGFKVGCTSVTPAYPNVPAGCPTTACFPANASIPPLAPGASATIVFETPVPDSLIYPFTSNEPDDSAVANLNDGQWSLM